LFCEQILKLLADHGADAVAAGGGLHAAVLGLKAAALTAPYDVPSWLPEVLTALAAAASAPPPTGKVHLNLLLARTTLSVAAAAVASVMWTRLAGAAAKVPQLQSSTLSRTMGWC